MPYGLSGFHPGFSTGGGGSSISATVQPPTLHEVGGGGIMPVLTWTSGGGGGGGGGGRQACVTIHGCKIAYVHIQLSFEISVSLKISGGMIPPPPPTDPELRPPQITDPPPPVFPLEETLLIIPCFTYNQSIYFTYMMDTCTGMGGQTWCHPFETITQYTLRNMR